METSPVIHLVTDAKGTVIHEVHVQMQELPLGVKALAPEVGAGGGEWPLCSVSGSVPGAGSSGNRTDLGLPSCCSSGCRADGRPVTAEGREGCVDRAMGRQGPFLSEDVGCAVVRGCLGLPCVAGTGGYQVPRRLANLPLSASAAPRPGGACLLQ